MFLSKKEKENIYFFIKSLFISFQIFLNKLWPKKYKASHKFIIISAVYNVEKYLDDFFISLIKQRLDFKNNILLICVDDGSEDGSAKLIQKYQKNYPQNIIYLRQKNAGQASARNMGLDFLDKNNFTQAWLSFIDPDDFVGRSYFYEMDKFLSRHEELAMVGTKIIFYREKRRILYKDIHALNYKFHKRTRLFLNKDLNENIQLSAAACFIRYELIKGLRFDEGLRTNFEDGKFITLYLLKNIKLKSAFLKKATYFYRKRFENNSTLNKKSQNKDFYLSIPERGYLELLKEDPPLFLKYLVLYDLFWQIKELINAPEKLAFLNEEERKKYLSLLDENFKYIDSKIILAFKLNYFLPLHKLGIINCFKKEKLPTYEAKIEELDDKKNQILLSFLTADLELEEELFFDDEKLEILFCKIRQYDFLNRVFIYEKRIWLNLPNEARELRLLINKQKIKIFFENKELSNLKIIYKRIKSLQKKRSRNSPLWLLADSALRADDNAEHLYRYIKAHRPRQKIAFILSKKSKDYARLKRENFKLIDPKSFCFKWAVFRADKLISSHIDRYFYEALGEKTLEAKDFIFLQHGLTKDDLSRWLNEKKIDLFITASQAEFESIVGDFNHYKFTKKEVKLTGFPRWDELIKNNKINTKQILIMPSWREYLVGTYSRKLLQRRFNEKFYESEYFFRWNSFLQSQRLRQIAEKNNYTIIFHPHPNILQYLPGFHLPAHIKTADEGQGIQRLFCESNIMISDYSSVAFEMKILNKKIICYQFDRDDFFTKHIMQKGYFDYSNLGPVVLSQEELFLELEKII